jgi:hypothetical protein
MFFILAAKKFPPPVPFTLLRSGTAALHKEKAPNISRMRLEVWSLKFLWCLDVGAW